MSKRPKHVERDKRDFYPTPMWAVDGLYRTAPKLPFATLDPCAGDGNLVLAGQTRRGAKLDSMRGVEKDPELVAAAQARKLPVVQGDGLEAGWGGEHILLNPPFGDFERWIEKGLDEAVSVCALLRLAVLASEKRREAWRRWGLRALYVLSSRPSFTRDGKADASDYAWFFWSKRPLDQLSQGLISIGWIEKPQGTPRG